MNPKKSKEPRVGAEGCRITEEEELRCVGRTRRCPGKAGGKRSLRSQGLKSRGSRSLSGDPEMPLL